MALVAKSNGDDTAALELAARTRKLQRMAYAVLDNAESIRGIKAAVADDDPIGGAQLWFELDDRDRIALWVATSKGGIFTTLERRVIREWWAYRPHVMGPQIEVGAWD